MGIAAALATAILEDLRDAFPAAGEREDRARPIPPWLTTSHRRSSQTPPGTKVRGRMGDSRDRSRRVG